ncbi:hypothetical protein CWM47_33920 [Spirosoma pollinicola]|uniref:Uncharacterized protein n=1 Tax=Spirosoma pollinicola TaxID=2057025 RepID=A0A2K8Z957_9BACT|nr:hypothetical protein CWM47_33920 [Spirosoma pollinicola]
MVLFLFLGNNENGRPQNCTYGGPDLESGLEMLTGLVNGGWQLSNVRVLDGNRQTLVLPIEIFDGISFKEPIKKLQTQWEDLLLLPS